MLRNVKLLLIALITFASTVQVSSATVRHHTHHISQAKQLNEAEEKLIDQSYVLSLDGAYWAIDQGPRIIPVLDKMLHQQGYYRRKYAEALRAFPFNAIWALAHMQDPQALQVLKRYYRQTHDDTTKLAIAGYELRHKHGWGYGVLYANYPEYLYAKPSESSSKLALLKEGTPLKLLKIRVENNREEGPRGGPSIFDYVQVLSTGQKGYIMRAGDDFIGVI